MKEVSKKAQLASHGKNKHLLAWWLVTGISKLNGAEFFLSPEGNRKIPKAKLLPRTNDSRATRNWSCCWDIKKKTEQISPGYILCHSSVQWLAIKGGNPCRLWAHEASEPPSLRPPAHVGLPSAEWCTNGRRSPWHNKLDLCMNNVF